MTDIILFNNTLCNFIPLIRVYHKKIYKLDYLHNKLKINVIYYTISKNN